ncbi:MAG: peptidoglycan-binding domain-containing protein, partial [Pseudomonadota bacterium]
LLAANPSVTPDIGELPALPPDSPQRLPEPEITIDIVSMTDAERINEIQSTLADLGYDPGPVDGLMGSRTRSAIESFESDIGRTPTGEPSNYIVAALRLASLRLGTPGGN